MSKARLVITAVVVEDRPVAEVAATTACPGLVGLRAHGPLPTPRATPRSNPGPDAPRPHRGRHRRRPVDLVLRLRKQLTEAGLDAGAGHHRLAPRQHHHLTVSRATDRPQPDPAGARHTGAEEAPEVVLHPLRGREAQRDLAVRLHPLPAHHPRPDTEIITWLDDHARYALHGHRPHPGHRPDRARHLPQRRRPARHPRLDPHRQRHGLHHPPGRRQRRPQRLRAPSSRLEHGPEELPTQPPHHLRQSRTLPTDPQEVAARPTRPAGHHRRAADPARPVRRPSTTTTDRTGPCRPLHPRRRLQHPAQSPPGSHRDPDTHDRIRHDRIDNSGNVTLRVHGQLRHIGVGRTHTEPTSSCSSRTSTSASSTPSPANSSANSPSTPAATTTPDDHPAPTPKPQRPEPTIRGSGLSGMS